MNFSAIQRQLNDLPPTFKRLGSPYGQWVDSLTALLALFCQGVDGLMAQLSFPAARYGWLDTWGTLLGIQRRPNEADSIYQARIQYTLLSWRANAVAMQNWLSNVEMVAGEVNENLPSVGYTVVLPPTLTSAQIAQIIADLAYVRPAGVPFNVLTQSGGTYLGTVNYMGGAPRVTGAYLGGAYISQPLNIAANTNNVVALLPDLLLTDPTINPPT
jgi:hypothetical protein